MKLIKNYLLYLVYQISLMILPLITIPYITRVLGSSGVGTYAFIDSVAMLFITIGCLGLNLHGNREIAYARENIEKRSRVFWEVFWLRAIALTFTLAIYLTYVMFFVNTNHSIYLIFSILIINYAITIAWLFSGMEDFKKWVSRGFIVKLVAVSCIFIFVKSPADLWKYCFIYSFAELLSAIALWFYARKYIKFVKVALVDIFKHFKPVCLLFIPQMAISIYFIIDRFLLGLLSTNNEVAFYDMALKIVRVSATLVTSMSFVMQPRISNIFASGDINKIKEYTYKTFDFASFLAIPIGIGILSIAPEFVPWFFGEEFLKVIPVISIISLVAIPMAWSSILGAQLMVSIKKENLYSNSLIIAAATSIALNLILIPFYKSIGTGIALVVSQTILVSVQLFMLKDILSIKRLLSSFWKPIISSLMFFFAVRIIGVYMNTGQLTTIIQIFAGSIIYLIILYLLKCETNKLVINKLDELTKSLSDKKS